jgi:N-acetylmuramoyl-L-alanine amidase
MILAAALLAAALTLPASAGVLTVNGENLWTQAKARYINETTYVSLRTVAGVLAPDAQVSWTGWSARVDGDGIALEAVPGQNWLTFNGRAIYLPDGVVTDSGSVLVPIRALAAALGGTVDWSREAGVTLTVGSGRPGQTPYTADQLDWLARIISAESRGEPLLGKLAVGNVVLNRVASDQFPNTIYGVIFDRQWGVQFAPTENGTIYDDPTEESILAAKMCLEGASVVGDSLYFLAPDLTENHWIMANRTWVATIGCHWFYR